MDVNKIKKCSIFPTLKNIVVKLTIDPYVKPVQQPLRRIPIAVEKLVEEKLESALQRGIIEKVDGPSPWISPMVIAFKSNGDIRICIDMRRANQAIIRENYPIPTFDLMMTKLRKAQYFSKIDLSEAYHQLELHEESRIITTFITHKGLFRYKRLMFGVNSAVEIYQKTLEALLANCKNCINFLDDIIVFGDNETDHDNCLKKVLSVLDENNATRNEDKCIYKVKELNFLGHKLSHRGINVDSNKVDTIINFRSPENKEELRSFLGLVSYLGKFIPNLGTETDALRQLIKTDSKFNWSKEHEQDFTRLKQRLAHLPTLSYFDPGRRTRLIADASPVALGAVLLQFDTEGNPLVISFASKSLSTTEKRYSQTEKESLALVWSVERFYLYLAGLKFELETDHKPLEAIFKPSSKPPARIERWLLRLQAFDFEVVYKAGKSNIADQLSRLCKLQNEKSFDSEEETHIFRIIEESIPKALNVSKILSESRNDLQISDAIIKVCDNSWAMNDKNIYYPFRMELANMSSILLRGNKIVIPTSLTKQVLDLAHEGHPVETVIKRRLRAKVWWPSLDKETTAYVKSCRDCLLVSQPNRAPPMARHEFPRAPWLCLAMDLMGPLPNKEMIFVVIDYYSRFTEVRFLKSTTSAVIIKHLNDIYTRFGIPKKMTVDNGRQFISTEIKNFCNQLDIELIQTPPYWPQANGEVENMNKSILKRLQIAHTNGQEYKEAIQQFLFMYHATPHGTTGKSPSELLFGRNIRDKIPSINDLVLEDLDGEVRDNDALNKQKGKEREDVARASKEDDISVGDKVITKRLVRSHKLQTNFGKEEYEVIGRKGNEVTLMKDGQTLQRHVSHVKRAPDTQSSLRTHPIEGDSGLQAPGSNQEPVSETSQSSPTTVTVQSPRKLPSTYQSSLVTPATRSSRRSSSFTEDQSQEKSQNNGSERNSSLFSQQVTPLKLKKKEGLWRTVQH